MESWIPIFLNLPSRSLTHEQRTIEIILWKVWMTMSIIIKSFIRWQLCIHQATSLGSKETYSTKRQGNNVDAESYRYTDAPTCKFYNLLHARVHMSHFTIFSGINCHLYYTSKILRLFPDQLHVILNFSIVSFLIQVVTLLEAELVGPRLQSSVSCFDDNKTYVVIQQ